MWIGWGLVETGGGGQRTEVLQGLVGVVKGGVSTGRRVSSDLNESITSCQRPNAQISICPTRPPLIDTHAYTHTHTHTNTHTYTNTKTTQAATDTISKKSLKKSANVRISSVCNHRAIGDPNGLVH